MYLKFCDEVFVSNSTHIRFPGNHIFIIEHFEVFIHKYHPLGASKFDHGIYLVGKPLDDNTSNGIVVHKNLPSNDSSS